MTHTPNPYDKQTNPYNRDTPEFDLWDKIKTLYGKMDHALFDAARYAKIAGELREKAETYEAALKKLTA